MGLTVRGSGAACGVLRVACCQGNVRRDEREGSTAMRNTSGGGDKLVMETGIALH